MLWKLSRRSSKVSVEKRFLDLTTRAYLVSNERGKQNLKVWKVNENWQNGESNCRLSQEAWLWGYGWQSLKWPPGIHTFVKPPPLECGLDLAACFWWIEYSKSDRMSLPRLGYKETRFCLAHPFLYTLLIPVKTICHAVGCSAERPTRQRTLEASGQYPLRKWVPWSNNLQGTKPCHYQMNELRNGSSSRQAFFFFFFLHSAWVLFNITSMTKSQLGIHSQDGATWATAHQDPRPPSLPRTHSS